MLSRGKSLLYIFVFVRITHHASLCFGMLHITTPYYTLLHLITSPVTPYQIVLQLTTFYYTLLHINIIY